MKEFTVEKKTKVRGHLGETKTFTTTFTRKEKSKEILQKELDWKFRKDKKVSYEIK